MRIDNTSVLTYKHIYSNLLKNPKMNATKDALRRRTIRFKTGHNLNSNINPIQVSAIYKIIV